MTKQQQQRVHVQKIKDDNQWEEEEEDEDDENGKKSNNNNNNNNDKEECNLHPSSILSYLLLIMTTTIQTIVKTAILSLRCCCYRTHLHYHNHKLNTNRVKKTMRKMSIMANIRRFSLFLLFCEAKVADRSRVVQLRQNSGIYSRHRDFGLPIEGHAYRSIQKQQLGRQSLSLSSSSEDQNDKEKEKTKKKGVQQQGQRERHRYHEFVEKERANAIEKLRIARKEHAKRIDDDGNQMTKRTVDAKDETFMNHGDGIEKGQIQQADEMIHLLQDSNKYHGKNNENDVENEEELEEDSIGQSQSRRALSQLTGCCQTYQNYDSSTLCGYYGKDCDTGAEASQHSDDEEQCSQDGLSFIGISFSVNTANGNPYSYQLCDQFPMENIIDRNYDYIMSMDEDGWLVGGGYKQFDYSGKMPYIDSSHTELLRIGSLDPNKGGTTIAQVYAAMSATSFAPFSIFPEYLKAGGGHHSGDDGEDSTCPSSDVTLIVSVVETYNDGNGYSDYENFLYNLFSAMESVNGGPCMDDHDTDPHVSMARGVKFKSSYHQQQYMYNANLEVSVWQAMYPNGVVVGSGGYAAFPPGIGGTRQYVGYGNLYFFFDRANITKAFPPKRDLYDTENYYSTLYANGGSAEFYSSVTSVGFDYQGSGDDGENSYEHNPYQWKTNMALHDFTDGWDLPPDCHMEGETFVGIPLSRHSESKLQSSKSFQDQFDFEYIVDRNYTYIESFGTNHGWLVGEAIGNSAGSIVDKDTAHLPLFYLGTTNADMGGMTLSNMIKVLKTIEFGALYIKPAFVFVDSSGHIKLQMEADSTSSLGYLYDNLCKMLGISWNYQGPYNKYGLYTNCAMHAAGDRASYGCGPDNSNSGGFCPQVTLAYKARFQSDDHAAAFLSRANNYIDYWRSLYPYGVATGTSSFCPDDSGSNSYGSGGGCLALFLNRYDVYYVFRPDLSGSWVEFNGGTMAPTFSPHPTWYGGCDEPHNWHLDKCFRKRAPHRMKLSAFIWDSLGRVGQFSVMLVVAMSITLLVSVFLARAKKRRRRGESYAAFFWRDMTRKKRKRRLRPLGSGRRQRSGGGGSRQQSLREDLIDRQQSRGGGTGGGRFSRATSRLRTRDRSKNKHENNNDDVNNNSKNGVGDGEKNNPKNNELITKKNSGENSTNSRKRSSSSRSGRRPTDDGNVMATSSSRAGESPAGVVGMDDSEIPEGNHYRLV